MKGYAEFAMRGPLQGAAAAALPTATLFLAWLGAAIVALWVLRHGVARSLPVFLGALVPAIFWLQAAGDFGPVTTVIVAIGLAQVLRIGKDWSLALMALPFIVGAWFIAVMVFAPDYVEFVRSVFEQMLENLKERFARSIPADELERMPQLQAPDATQLMGLIAVMQAITAVFSLLVARWCQAMLYNPGGFRQEFHALRMSRVHALVLVAGFVTAVALSGKPAWAWLFIVPLLVAGTALFHGVASSLGLGTGWLVAYYLLVYLFARPLMALVAAMAVADSALDIRARVAAGLQKKGPGD